MENIEAMLCAFVEGDLDEAGRAQIEKHLESNPQHRKLLNELVQMKEMVRGLPRVKAPVDVGDSLRQKVERTMLLEDEAVVRPIGKQVDRWPQVFAIAAMFLLVSSLCFIVYRALAPTLKPAVFTQTVDKFKSPSPDLFDRKLDDVAAAGSRAEVADKTKSQEMNSPAVSPPAGGAVYDSKIAAEQAGKSMREPGAQQFAIQQAPAQQNAVSANAAPQNAASQNAASQNLSQVAQAPAPTAAQPQQSVVQTQQALGQLQKANVTQVDLVAIRRRLQNSGYGIDQLANKAGGATLVLVNSSDLPATKQQITQFLNNNNGVSWNAVPEDDEGQARSGFGGNSNRFQGGQGGGGGAPGGGGGTATSDFGAAMQPMNMNDQVAAKLQSRGGRATTEPSSDVYVARGLTPQQVDALRQTLSVPQNGSAVQVEVKSVNDLSYNESPTTQPAVAMPKDVNVAGMANGVATSQPSEPANAAADLSMPATTMPAQDGVAAAERDRSVASNAAPLRPVDAVIVLQSAAVTTGSAGNAAGMILGNSVSGGGAATQPDVAPSVPTTQPETGPTTQP